MAEANAPIDIVGTGSFLPQRWTETYATADIIEYDGIKRVKIGREVTDSLTVARRFPALAAEGNLSVRLDTPGSRFIEGLDPSASYASLDRNVPDAIRGYRNETELRHLVGAGVSAAAVWHLREALNREGFQKVKIVASSGFDPAKCKVMAEANAPIDIIGTGSFLPQRWTETYATADIIEYNGVKRVKIGREFLFRK